MSSRLVRSISAVTALVVALTSAGLPLAGFSPSGSLPERNAGCRCSLNRILSGTCCCSRKADAEEGGCCSRPASSDSESKPPKPPVRSCCSKPAHVDEASAEEAPQTKPGCQCQPEETSIVIFPPVPRWEVIALPTPHADPSLDVREVRSDVCCPLFPAPETPPPRQAV